VSPGWTYWGKVNSEKKYSGRRGSDGVEWSEHAPV
jgi:hypothetical protein